MAKGFGAKKPAFSGKKAAPFKSGGGRSQTHRNTAKGMPRKGVKRGGY